MDNSKTGAPQQSGTSTNTPSIEDLLSQGNWEERVAAARKKRDALKAESPKKAASPAPTFPEFDPNGPSDDSFVFSGASTAEPEAPAAQPIDLMAKLAARNPAVTQRGPAQAAALKQPADTRPRPTLIAPVSTIAAAPQPEAKKEEKSKVALVAFACFFGIGVGLALGAGLVWSLGGFGGIQPNATQQTAAGEASPRPLQFTVPLAASQIAPSTLSGLIVPPVSGTALTRPMAFQPAPIELASLSRAAPPLSEGPGPRFAPAVTETASAQTARPFTLGPVPALGNPIAAPSLLSGLTNSTAPEAPIVPTARPSPVQVQSSIAGLLAPGLNLPEVGAIASESALPDVSPVILAMQRPVGEPFAVPAPFAPPPPVEPLLTIAPNFAGPVAGTLNPVLPNWSAAPRIAPQQVALQRPLTKTDLLPPAVVAPSATFPSLSFDVAPLTEPETIERANTLPDAMPLALFPNQQALQTPPSISGDLPAAPLATPARPTALFAEQPEHLEQQPAAPSLALALSPFESSTVPTSLSPLVARYEAWAPKVVTAPWRAPNFLAQIGMTAEQTTGLEFVLNAPDSVPEDDLVARAALLDATGLALQKQNRVSFKITKPHIRYYNNADARLAQALAVKFDVEVRDFSRNGADNGPNRIEFWMAGQTDRKPAVAKRVAKKKSPPRRKTVRRVDPTQALRQKLARKLRQGDHL